MKKRLWLVSWATLVSLTMTTMGQGVVITSIQGNGQLSWTNIVSTNGLCRIEWASSASGPWYRSFQPIQSIDTHSNNAFTVAVPMFYRVVMATNQPPVGMVWIDGGDVELGDARTNGDFFVGTAPVHTNYISGFWMDATEVTKAQWDDVADWAWTNGYDILGGHGDGKTNNHPVQRVSWFESVKWCNARSQKEGLNPCYYLDETTSSFAIYKTGNANLSNAWVKWNSGGYRLPTEAEWEKAARGGRQRRLFPWGGDTIQHARANYYADTNSYAYDTSPTQGYHPNYQTGGFPYTSPVGSFPANGYGLHDMAGNVHEWCWDWYAAYSASYQTDPYGSATGTYRVLRSTSWGDSVDRARCAHRASSIPNFESIGHVGFRCARGP